MYPILFTLFGEPILSWYVFLGLAVLGGFFLFTFLAQTHPEDTFFLESRGTLLIVTYSSAWLGARSLSEIVEGRFFEVLWNTPLSLVGLGPMTFYGGAISGFIAGTLYTLYNNQSVKRGIDLAAPATVLGLGIGRVGCFLNGDDYGIAVSTQHQPPFWAVSFPNLGDSVWRYPTQIEEALFSVILVCVLVTLWKRRGMRPGQLGAFTVLGSALNRFLNEEYRADFRGHFLGTHLTTSQGISLALIAACCMVLMNSWLRHREIKSPAESKQ